MAGRRPTLLIFWDCHPASASASAARSTSEGVEYGSALRHELKPQADGNIPAEGTRDAWGFESVLARCERGATSRQLSGQCPE
jgi:hypothetical protein